MTPGGSSVAEPRTRPENVRICRSRCAFRCRARAVDRGRGYTFVATMLDAGTEAPRPASQLHSRRLHALQHLTRTITPADKRMYRVMTRRALEPWHVVRPRTGTRTHVRAAPGVETEESADGEEPEDLKDHYEQQREEPRRTGPTDTKWLNSHAISARPSRRGSRRSMSRSRPTRSRS